MKTKNNRKGGKKKGTKNINEMTDLKGKLFQQETIDVCLYCEKADCSGVCAKFPKP